MSEQHQIDHNLGLLRKKLVELYQNVQLGGLPWLNRGIGDSYVNPSDENKTLTDLFPADGNIEKAARILIKGHIGYGKTTLCLKICYDWALKKERCVQCFDLVLLLPMREFTGLSSLPSLAESVWKDRTTLWEILKDTSKKILLILDGYDELNDEYEEAFLALLHGDFLPHVTLVVTARPDNFSSEGVKKLRHPAENDVANTNYLWTQEKSIEGISRSKRAEYVQTCSKRFARDATVVKNIVEKASSTEKPFDSPMLLLLLAAVSETEEVSFPCQSKTNLYKAFFNNIARRWLKDPSDPDYQSYDLFDAQNGQKAKVEDEVRQLGKIALDALSSRMLSFAWKKVKSELESNHRVYELGFIPKNSSLNDLLHEPIHTSVLEFAVAYHLWKMYQEGKKSEWQIQLAKLKPKTYNSASSIIPFLKDLMNTESSELLNALGYSQRAYDHWFNVPGFAR